MAHLESSWHALWSVMVNFLLTMTIKVNTSPQSARFAPNAQGTKMKKNKKAQKGIWEWILGGGWGGTGAGG